MAPVPVPLHNSSGMLHESADAGIQARADGTERAGRDTRGQRDPRRGDALRKVVESISSELDLNSLLARVAESTVNLLDATRGSISLVESDGEARIRAVHNMPAPLVGVAIGPVDGLTGQVLATHRPAVVRDYARDLSGPLAGLEHLRAGIAVPIWWQSRLVGIFAVFDEHEGRVFDEHDRETMELLAQHVAIAIENARLYGEARARVTEMVGIQQIGTLLLEEHDFDRVLHAVCEQVQRLTDAEGIGLALLDESGRFLEIRAAVGPNATVLRGTRIPIEGSFGGEALRRNKTLRSADAPNDPRGYKPSLLLGNTRTLLSVPMKTRQRTVGVLSIYNKRDTAPGDGFTDRDAELAALFANQAAVAVENARLYEQTREFAVIEERNRLARELHDSVTQSLFSVALLSQASLSLWDKDPPKARERLERAHELASGALAEMRALIFQLRPMALQEEGLISALKKHAVALRSRHGLDVKVEVDGPEQRLAPAVEEAALRIVQESLNNVVKHARATGALVRLEFHDKHLRICTEDNGVGFNPGATGGRGRARTLGMSSMRERADEAGGSMRVESQPGRGTRVLIELPFPATAGEDGRVAQEGSTA